MALPWLRPRRSFRLPERSPHRQAVQLTQHHVIRRAAMTGSVVIFRDAEPELVTAGEKQQRIVTAADQHWTGLARAEIFFTDLAAVLTRRYPYIDVIAILHHRSVSRRIDPLSLRVAHNDKIVGADVAAAVQLVQPRHRK